MNIDMIEDCSGSTVRSPPSNRRGWVEKPKGSYEYYRDLIARAVADDVPPSLDLIEANHALSSWEAYLGIGRVSSFPIAVFLAINEICNARCSFCSYSPERSPNRKLRLSDIERADWLKFVRNFAPNTSLSEPLTHPDFAAILSTVRRLAPFIKIQMTTNASLLSGAALAAVGDGVDLLIVSLNAAQRETYEATMKPLKWETTIGNLRALAEHRRSRPGGKLDVQVSYVLHRHNLDELPEVPALLSSLGIKKLRVQAMIAPSPVDDRKLFTDADGIYAIPEKANRVFELVRRRCRDAGIALVFPLPILV